ncbi:ATP-NAD kinase [Halobiforma lacisalsi AJ5]|uniref:ATP-NAD kinase n=1 Tax=Natronobacterium lacisalsi AJ5 TaxID=358396 RepID=M0LRA6_NATLA|nr:NAD(+)/NADH kinase [Halobiforma lacisalsi]APW99587.1 ATP-NAD kinase [Halobiforma lacisalsi AJ5]EMA35628.1 ATP-NAD/AcoX kinase [Halobiforma lacisalsi AJ5]
MVDADRSRSSARVGLLVNPAAGRDVRRLTGGASVVDNYAKRRVAECVLEGLTLADPPVEVVAMPDRTGIAVDAIETADESLATDLLEMDLEGTAADTRTAAARFRETVDAAVVLGGDGTTRDVAGEIGPVPVVAVSTGTNNVVPTPIDGTLAGAAAALVASGAVPADAVTTRHGRVEAELRSGTASGDGRRLTALASAELSSRSFVGTRALLDPADLRGGVVSRAHPGDVGLPAVAGALVDSPVAGEDPGGVAVRLEEPSTADRTVRAVVAPGVLATVGIESWRWLEPGESVTFDLADGVVGADGERELEATDATAELRPIEDGPRLVDASRALEIGARNGGFDVGSTASSGPE